ncbi:hypothetical protein CQW23_25510 [Capsicum baccatum]|uniref:Uncharacterized protein n=1 Tax=Capsicum baccatum TaxID=33114 RepID=A0A2G2VL66_CAPBA|nr:hypothetical protein CQW23_25510 [Capsicum baccatum]
MGTQVHYKGFLPSYYSMRDLNEDSNSSSWPLFYGDKTVLNGQYCNGFASRTVTDAYPRYDKDILKQKMLEHEAIFRNQVVELHRLYRIQRDMMDELRRKEMHKLRSSMEPSCSSSHLGSQVPSEDVRKWHIQNFPLENSSYTRPSASGTEIINSPFGSSKRDGVQLGQGQMQNGYSSKASDILEARPSKVRKKLFDLHLPADDYLDTEEVGQLRDNEGSLNPSYPANGNYVVTQESGSKLFLGGGGGDAKGGSRKDASTSNLCLRSSIGLADLNEPAQLDEATDPVDFLGYVNNHKETRSINASAKSNPPFVALPWNSNCISPNKSSSILYDRSRGKEREWLASAYETGNIKGSSASLPRGLEEDKISAASHQAPVMINKAYQAPGAQLVHHIKDGIWKDRMGHSLDMSHRNGEQSNYTQVGPFVASKMASSYPCASSSEFSSSWPHSVSSWEKSNGSFTQRLSSLHTNSFFNSSAAVGKGSQSSQGQIGDHWPANGSSRLRPGCAGELPIQSSFYHGSSSGTKESSIHVPSTAFDSLSHIKGDRFTSERPSNNARENFLISPNNTDVKPAKGFNLNVLATSALCEEPPRRDVEFGNEKREHQDPMTVLPWLKSKANGKHEGVDTRTGGTSANSGFVQAYSNPPPFCQSGPSTLEHHHMKTRKEVSEMQHVRKILGVPILDMPIASRNESSPLVSASTNLHSSPERGTIKHERRSMVIDINVACDMIEPEEPAAVEQIVTEKVMETKAIIRNHFDLNSCISEDEEPISAETDKATVKTILDIDLEAPAVMDIEQDNLPGEDNDKQREASSQLPEHKPEHTEEELLRTAAEAIVAISSSTHCTSIEETHSDPSDDPLESLLWFVDVVSSCAAELDSTAAKETTCKNTMMVAHSSFKELDYFEAMTLQLTETKPEDYMPKPFVPEVQILDEAGANSLTNRPRRGNARRGRQRRDFQRDILPGLVSLSRHEVTEDIQIFGGLMRATGHAWNSSLTRRNGTRNGGARGRRKKVVDTTTPAPPVSTTTTTSSQLMHQFNNIEASLEDKSITGWGKTPRRPRRQRCPAGNPPAVLLT